MSLFKKNSTETSEKGLQVRVKHELINKDQAEVFTNMVKETVKILAIGIVLTTVSALTLKLGADYLNNHFINP